MKIERCRLAFCQGKTGRPGILITKEFDIYLANLQNEELVIPSGELFGFFTGTYDQKIIKGGWGWLALKFCLMFSCLRHSISLTSHCAIPKLIFNCWWNAGKQTNSCPGLGEREAATIPWRLEADTTLVAHDKKPLLLCQYICQLAREQGLVDVQVEDHQLKQKMKPAVETCKTKQEFDVKINHEMWRMSHKTQSKVFWIVFASVLQ